MITPPTGSRPVERLRRTISHTQFKALDVLRKLKASSHPPPQLPPHQDETTTIVIPQKKEDSEK